MKKPDLKQVARYRFDSFMARGGSSIFISLVVIFLSLWLTIGIVRLILFMIYGAEQTERGVGTLGQLYIVFLAMTDPGNMNQDVTSHHIFKFPAMLAGFSGIVILSSLIAFITTALDQKIAQLKKGRSKVIEEGHTLILGWNERVVEIIRELVIANESEDNPCVVILSEQDKEFMDDYLNVHMKDTQNTRVVTRSGSISSLANLDIASIQECKSVIVLAFCSDTASDGEKSVSDTRVLKTILGVVASKADGQKLNIVAELFFDASRRIAEEISTEEITTVDAKEILAKILVQTSRSVGLSVVYGELLSFDGCEMYFYNNPEWAGTEFGKLQFHFPDGVPIGIRTEDGELFINPPVDRKMTESDEVLIVADDNSTIEFRPAPVATPREFPLASHRAQQAIENELIIGWTKSVPSIVSEYSDYVLDASSISLLINKPDGEVLAAIKEMQEEHDNLEIRLIDGNPLDVATLAAVEPWKYNNIIILSQSAQDTLPETTDSQTIVTLLLLRTIFDKNSDKVGGTKLITEVMDSENQPLIARSGVNDFVISNRFVSMILAQLSEERDMKRVYDDLFSEDGSEIYLKPAALYMDQFPAEMTFADIMLLAQKREEVCIGVKIKAKERAIDENFGVKLIPLKDSRYTIQPDDCFIVVAENET